MNAKCLIGLARPESEEVGGGAKVWEQAGHTGREARPPPGHPHQELDENQKGDIFLSF